ncbi:MAG: DUF2950 family protein [Planctomycetes bacterium]|nr:DUF2950 family protein [Planctomycetota bacterium]
MSLRFACECGNRLELPESEAGKLATCPVCKLTFQVPTPEEAARISQAVSAPTGGGPGPAGREKGGTTKVAKRASVAKKPCPHCKEPAPVTATTCPFCHGDLTDPKAKVVVPRTSKYAVFGVFLGAGALGATILGSLLLARTGRGIFWLTMPAGLVAAGLGAISRKDILANKALRKKKIDLLGLPLALGGIATGGIATALSLLVLLFTTPPRAARETNEESAVSALRMLVLAERKFFDTNPWQGKRPAYWVGDVAGLSKYTPGGESALGLIPAAIAEADQRPLMQFALLGEPRPYHDYLFRVITLNAKGQSIQTNEAFGFGDFLSNVKFFAFCAFPTKYPDGGIHTFMVNEVGEIWRKNTEGKPVEQWPRPDDLQKDWVKVK